MGYRFFEPCIVYGFHETQQTKILCSEFLEKHDIERYALFTHNGKCFGILYGKSCKSIEDMNEIDTSTVDSVFALVSKRGEYNAPKIMLALRGHLTLSEYDTYTTV